MGGSGDADRKERGGGADRGAVAAQNRRCLRYRVHAVKGSARVSRRLDVDGSAATRARLPTPSWRTDATDKMPAASVRPVADRLRPGQGPQGQGQRPDQPDGGRGDVHRDRAARYRHGHRPVGFRLRPGYGRQGLPRRYQGPDPPAGRAVGGGGRCPGQ